MHSTRSGSPGECLRGRTKNTDYFFDIGECAYGEADDAPACRFRIWILCALQIREAGLPVERARVMNAIGNACRVKKFFKGGAVVAQQRVLCISAFVAGCGLGRAYTGKACEKLIVQFRVAHAAGEFFIQMAELYAEYRRLERIQPAVEPDAFMKVARGTSVVREFPYAARESVVCREDGAAVPGTSERLRGVKTGRGDVAERAGGFSAL